MMNIGWCCTLAAKIQAAFYEGNFNLFLFHSAIHSLVLSNVYVQANSQSILEVLVVSFVVIFVSNFFALIIEQSQGCSICSLFAPS